MISSTFHIGRLLAAWLGCYLIFAIIVAEGTRDIVERDVGGYFALLALFLGLWVLSGVFSHMRRVRLIAGSLNSSTLSNRQRRQIEIPFEPGEAFDLIDAAIRELPGAILVESARDSLQVRAKVKRINPYAMHHDGQPPAASWAFIPFGERRNQILATVTPNGDCRNRSKNEPASMVPSSGTT